MNIDVINETDRVVPSNADFCQWANLVLQHTNKEGELAIRIIDEPSMSTYNETFRGKKGPTNVLSFPDDDEFSDDSYLGDIAICAKIVEQEALEQNKNLNDHYTHLTIHGVLHLLGYDHIEDDEAIAMEIIEITLLDQLNIDNPYD